MSALCSLPLQLVDQFMLENVSVHGGAGTEKQSQLYIGQRQLVNVFTYLRGGDIVTLTYQTSSHH